MYETNSRFLRMRSRNSGHARYRQPDRAEDYRPDHDTFETLADETPADYTPLDLRAHRPEVAE